MLRQHLTCFYCKKTEKSVSGLINHVKLEKRLPYKCSALSCAGRCFGNLESFRSHLKRQHEVNKVEEVQFLPVEMQRNLNLLDNQVEFPSPTTETIQQKLSKLRHEFLKIFLPIFSNEKIARKHAIENTKALCEHFKISLELVEESLLLGKLDKDEVLSIQQLIKELKCSINIRSEYMLLKELEKSNFYVRSLYVEFAKKQQEFRTFENVIKIRDITYGVSIFPLQPAFHKLFNSTTLLTEIIDYLDALKMSPVLENYVQGEHWKRIISEKEPSNTTLCLPLAVYFDDFEPNNALGGHSNIRKLGGLYVKLICLPPHLSSKLWTIIVAMIFHSEDRKEFSNQRILKPLINMLLDLENIGITLDKSIGDIQKIKVIPCLVLGDNLGLQQMLGYQVGFNTSYCCRICIVEKNIRKIMTTEDFNLLRKVEDYHTHCRAQLFGVENPCVFNKLQSIHIYRNMYVDIMHDILEGICHYVFSRVFHTFIHDKQRFRFKITDLNRRILIHNFGPGVHAKPMLISDDYMKQRIYAFTKLKYSASEMLTFTRHILLLIKELIPECIELELLKKLRGLISLFFQHKIQKNSIIFIKLQTEDFLESYKNLYGDLQPKFHNLLHYPRIIEEVGPLLNVACFGFEAVHQPLKKQQTVRITKLICPLH